MSLTIEPLDFGMSHHRTLGTAHEPSSFGMSHPRGFAQTIRLWHDHWILESHRTLESYIYFQVLTCIVVKITVLKEQILL